MTRARHRQHGNPFTVRGEMERPDWSAVFGRQAPFALDIGCGAGQFSLELARRHPEWNVVGLEIRQHFVDGLLAAARSEQLNNLHALLANANTHLDAVVPDGSVIFVSVNFPDPWFKKRHQKRRVVRSDWLEILAQKLRPDGELHIMTDYEPIAREALQMLEAAPVYENCEGCDSLATENTTGISSEREELHLSRGEPVFRMKFRLANR